MLSLLSVGLIPGLTQWVKDPALPWLWHRLAAVALVRPLVWEPPYALAVAPKRKKRERVNRTCYEQKGGDGECGTGKDDAEGPYGEQC